MPCVGDEARLRESWQPTRRHLEDARQQLAGVRGADAEDVRDRLDHDEPGLAFDVLVDLADELDVPPGFREALDAAAREMDRYADALRTPHLTAADIVLRHLAVARSTPRT